MAQSVGFMPYDSRRIFTWVADQAGLPVDQVNYLFCQFLALLLAPLFRTALHPSTTRPGTRHAVGLGGGVALGYFCFGMQAVHLGGLPALCYIIIRTQNPRIMQKMVLAVALVYLSCIHIYRQIYDYGSYTLDITGPLMVVTQKVTSLAFSLHDGLTRQDSELTDSQKHHAIRTMPTMLEYFSFLMCFQTLMCGPMVFYRDYMDFITGKNILKHVSPSSSRLDGAPICREVVREPSPYLVVFKKVVCSIVCAVIYVLLIPSFPISRLKETEFVEETSLWYKTAYLMVCTTLVRFKYYHAWLLADAICNMSGLGFNGYNSYKDGLAHWDLISNVDIFVFEFGLSLRDSIQQWNKGTTVWLRFIVYERVTRFHTVLSYALSAVWHGFYAGYYLTFMSGALFTFASRSVRRSVRPYFLRQQWLLNLYHVATFALTRITLAYATFSFVLLELWPSVRLYLHMYLWLHILALAALLLLPLVLPSRGCTAPAARANGVPPGRNGSVKHAAHVNGTAKSTRG